MVLDPEYVKKQKLTLKNIFGDGSAQNPKRIGHMSGNYQRVPQPPMIDYHMEHQRQMEVRRRAQKNEREKTPCWFCTKEYGLVHSQKRHLISCLKKMKDHRLDACQYFRSNFKSTFIELFYCRSC